MNNCNHQEYNNDRIEQIKLQRRKEKCYLPEQRTFHWQANRKNTLSVGSVPEAHQTICQAQNSPEKVSL